MRPSEREYVDDEIIPAARCSHTSQETEECPRMQTIFWKHSAELFRQKHITDDTGANDCPFFLCLGRESLAGRPATELRRASIVFLLLSSAMGARGGGG